jgi:competence protein CoiA
MKYALVNGERQQAQPKLSGKCELHGCSVIAKCGRVKVWHWAHIGQQNCDPSKEPETPWHRAWKDCFPKEWQEIVHTDANGQKHRADVKTDQGYAIEFQHSPIKFEEHQSREDVYKAIYVAAWHLVERVKNRI